MATYYVDDGGSATAPFDTWAKAATSLSALDDAVALASGDIVYIGHDHVCQFTHSDNRTITGPSATMSPCYVISATQGSDPPVYQASTTKQIDTTEGAYSLTFDGAFAFYGLSIHSGANITLGNDQSELFRCEDCVFYPAANGSLNGSSGLARITNCTIDLAADGTTSRTASIVSTSSSLGGLEIQGLSVINAAYRTGGFCDGGGGLFVSSSDLSKIANVARFANANNYGSHRFSNCKMPASYTAVTAANFPIGGVGYEIAFNNADSADNPSGLTHKLHTGGIVSSSSIYRSGGASFEGQSSSWLVTTRATCSEGSAYVSPWMYGYIASGGSKTFDVYITNDTADFTNAQVWLEVEYLGTADGAQWSRITDQRATITATAAAQDDDTTSTWVGTGPSFTYKQKLSVTATVAEEGQFRARVCVGVASIASSRYFYIDPKVTVS